MSANTEVQALQEVLDRMVDILEQALANGQEISDDLKIAVAEAITDSVQRINELQQQPPEQPPAPPEPSPQAPIPEGADLLWILAGGRQDAFVNYLRTFPDPAFNALLRNPQALQSTINNLSQRFPEGIQLQADGFQHAPLLSSNIYGFRYDPKSGRLLVRFNSGSIYRYDGIPKGVYQIFEQGAIPARTNGQNRWGRWWQGKIPSLGAAFYQLIRQGGYPYQRLQ